MNDRIKQLKAQALQECLDKSDNLVQGETITLREFHDLVEDRFVELIVKDACQALNPMLRDMISRGHAVDLIKEHFGVEE